MARVASSVAASTFAARLRHVVAAMLVLTATVAGTSPVAAHSFIARTFDELVTEADQILVGSVGSTQSRLLPSGAIVTDITVVVDQALKGAPEQTVSLMVLGRTIGDTTLAIPGFPVFAPGHRYVLFVRGNGRTILPLVGGTAGVPEVTRDSNSGRDLVATTPEGRERASWRPLADRRMRQSTSLRSSPPFKSASGRGRDSRRRLAGGGNADPVPARRAHSYSCRKRREPA